MPNAGIGANNAIYAEMETVYGTYTDPSAGSGLWIPIISESLVYTETKYYSEAIRQQAMDNDVQSSYYHVEGDIVMELDPTYFPLFMVASRHTTVEAGAGPYTYVSTPANIGSTYPGGTAVGLSITAIRNGVGFGYAGCVVNQYAFTIQDGVLRVTLSMLGLSEETPAGLGTPTWIAPLLLGATAHSVYVDAAGTAPAFATRDRTFNGFTATVNHNAVPQNRIVPDRAATYIAYGKTDLTYNTELDFLDKTEYDNFKAATKRAIKFESIKPGGSAGTYAAATSGFRISYYNSAYDAYEVDTPGIGDIVMARVTGHGLAQVGGSGYKMECKSPTTLGL